MHIVCAARAQADDGKLETTQLRLAKVRSICLASQYVAEALLRAEDLGMNFAAPLVAGVDQGAPVVILGGVHVGCFELFGGAGVHSVRDLKGRTVAVTSHYLFLASIRASVGVDPQRQGLSQALYFCCLAAANREFAQRHPVATQRALRSILKATDLCASDLESASRPSSRSVTTPTPSTRGRRSATCHTAAGASSTPRRPCASTRCGCMRPGMVKASPSKLIAQGTGWRMLERVKKELKT